MSAATSLGDIHILKEQTNGYLIVRGGRGLLIDCPSADMAQRLAAAGLPRPEVILHTQVQEEHCREWASLADVPVHVPKVSEDVARLDAAFYRDCQTVWAADRVWSAQTPGMEKYGVGGSVTERPPRQALNVAGVLVTGETFRWADVELQVVSLPGSGKRAVGFWWPQRRVLFCGDLLRSGGFLVNYYDLERTYGTYIGYEELLASLRTAAALKPELTLPSTGDPITDLAGDADRLRRRVEAVIHSPPRTVPPGATEPVVTVGAFRRRAEGLYQCLPHGNMIVYIDDQGRGLAIDPDLCVWKDWDSNCRAVHQALDDLEKHAGLKRIEWALITHYHADHMEYAPLLAERYGTQSFATADVAELLANPRNYPYACLLHWYNLPYDRFEVDHRLTYGQTLDWHGTSITAIHSPGHCWAHAAYLIPWCGLRTACTGDALQYEGGSPLQLFMPAMCNDVAWPDRSMLPMLDRLAEYAPDLVLGGHSHAFWERAGMVLRTWREVACELASLAAAALHDGDLLRAMTRPGYDAIRPVAAALLGRGQAASKLASSGSSSGACL